MAVFLGAYVGDQQVSAIYLGDTLVWSASPFDPDAEAYIAAVEAADGEPLEDEVKQAVQAFIAGCKSDPSPNSGVSNWEAIKTACLMCVGRTLSGALVPLKGTDTPINSGFTDDDYERFVGITGGSGKSVSSGRLNNVDPRNNKSVSVYISQPYAAATRAATQGYLAATNAEGHTQLLTTYNAGKDQFNVYFRLNSAEGQAAISTTYPTIEGLFGASRTNGSQVATLINGALSNQINSSVTPSSGGMLVLTRGSDYTLATMSFYHIGEAVDLTALDARLDTLMAALQTL